MTTQALDKDVEGLSQGPAAVEGLGGVPGDGGFGQQAEDVRRVLVESRRDAGTGKGGGDFVPFRDPAPAASTTVRLARVRRLIRGWGRARNAAGRSPDDTDQSAVTERRISKYICQGSLPYLEWNINKRGPDCWRERGRDKTAKGMA